METLVVNHLEAHDDEPFTKKIDHGNIDHGTAILCRYWCSAELIRLDKAQNKSS